MDHTKMHHQAKIAFYVELELAKGYFHIGDLPGLNSVLGKSEQAMALLLAVVPLAKEPGVCRLPQMVDYLNKEIMFSNKAFKYFRKIYRRGPGFKTETSRLKPDGSFEIMPKMGGAGLRD